MQGSERMEPAEGSRGTDGRWRVARKVAGDRVIRIIDPADERPDSAGS